MVPSIFALETGQGQFGLVLQAAIAEFLSEEDDPLTKPGVTH